MTEHGRRYRNSRCRDPVLAPHFLKEHSTPWAAETMPPVRHMIQIGLTGEIN